MIWDKGLALRAAGWLRTGPAGSFHLVYVRPAVMIASGSKIFLYQKQLSPPPVRLV